METFSSKEYFNVDRIVSILYTPEKPANEYFWVDPKPIKRFFGLIDTGKFTEAGWYTYYSSRPYTTEVLRSYGYIVYDTDERINERVCNKAMVKVYLTDDNIIEQSFDSNQKAEEWIELLKTTSGKTFEVATHY